VRCDHQVNRFLQLSQRSYVLTRPCPFAGHHTSVSSLAFTLYVIWQPAQLTTKSQLNPLSLKTIWSYSSSLPSLIYWHAVQPAAARRSNISCTCAYKTGWCEIERDLRNDKKLPSIYMSAGSRESARYLFVHVKWLIAPVYCCWRFVLSVIIQHRKLLKQELNNWS
jgi:hypothetical protein